MFASVHPYIFLSSTTIIVESVENRNSGEIKVIRTRLAQASSPGFYDGLVVIC